MKRSGPPARRTRLEANPEKQRAWEQRSRKGLPPRSAKRAAEAPQRREVVEAVIRRDGGCLGRTAWPEVECGGPLDGHEPGLRSRGADYLDPSQVICLCRQHHEATHGDRAKAVALGFLL